MRVFRGESVGRGVAIEPAQHWQALVDVVIDSGEDGEPPQRFPLWRSEVERLREVLDEALS